MPADIINFQYDPLACVIALGWSEGVEISQIPLKFESKDGLLHETIAPDGKLTPVVTKIDGKRFSELARNGRSYLKKARYVLPAKVTTVRSAKNGETPRVAEMFKENGKNGKS